MLASIAVFLMVLSPLFIPTLVTVVHATANFRRDRAARPTRAAATTVRPVRRAPVPA